MKWGFLCTLNGCNLYASYGVTLSNQSMKPFTPKALQFNKKTKNFFKGKDDIYQQATEGNT
jgi:hypothetical protein